MYQKDNEEIFIKKILKFPVMAIILFAVVFGSAATGAVFSFIATLRVYAWILLLVELFCCLVLNIYSERYQIMNSSTKLTEYRESCNKTYKWLKSCSVTTKVNIYELNQRVLSHISKLEDELKQKKERIDKWMQVLIIPIVLVMFSELINSKTDVTVIFGYAFLLFFILVFIYSLICGIRTVANLFSHRKLNQLYCFSNALQGVLDTQFDGSLLTSDDKVMLNDET